MPYDPCNDEIVDMLRAAAKRVTGGNCAFADDDLAVLEHLAERAVQAGMIDRLTPNIQGHIKNKEKRAENQARLDAIKSGLAS